MLNSDKPMEKTFILLAVSIFITLSTSCHQLQAQSLGSSDRVRIEFQPNKKTKEVRTGSIGANVATFRPELKITNSSITDFPKLKCCVIMMGEDTQKSKNWRVLMREEFPFDLPASETYDWRGKEFTQEFDKIMAKSGFEYDGHIVLIKNSEGEIVKATSSKPVWIKSPEFAWTMKKGEEFARADFK